MNSMLINLESENVGLTPIDSKDNESERLALSLMENEPLHCVQLMVQYNNLIKEKGLDMKTLHSGQAYMIQRELSERNLIDLRRYQYIRDYDTGEFVVLKYYQTKANVENTNENLIKDSQENAVTVTISKTLKTKIACNYCKNYDYKNKVCNDQQATATQQYPNSCKYYIFINPEKESDSQ